MTRRLCVRSIAAAMVAACVTTAPAAAQNWPNRFVSMVVPFAAGSGSDIVARILAVRMSEVLGQQVVVDNVGGAGGIVGVGRVAKAAPDGYTVALGAVDTFAQSQSLHKPPPYNSQADFVPAGLAVEQPLVLIVRRDLPVSNLAEFVAHMKANPSKLTYGSGGIGSAPQLACAQLASVVGVPVTHVPYRGSAAAMQDMLAGNLDFYCPLAVGAIPLAEAKSVKMLAILTPERSSLLPNLPTAVEQGVKVADGYYWIGFFFPKGTPEPIVAKFNEAVSAALDVPNSQVRLRDVGTTVMPREKRTPEHLRTFLDSEIKKWATLIEASGAAPK